MTERLLSAQDVMNVTGLGRTSIWRLERAGNFPARRQLMGHRVAWLASEVDAWMQGRPVVAIGGDEDAKAA